MCLVGRHLVVGIKTDNYVNPGDDDSGAAGGSEGTIAVHSGIKDDTGKELDGIQLILLPAL
jgi:hypothetical protein